MQVNIDLDIERIHKEVVDKVASMVHARALYDVERALKGTIIDGVREVARSHARQIVEDMILPDGRTFEQYVEQLLVGKAQYTDRPKLLATVENIVQQQARTWASELVEQHLVELKETLRKHIQELDFDLHLSRKA